MSLLDQSQQWFPTSVVVTVHQARNLRIKGKNGTNDAYAIIQVAKDKFSTSVAEKCVAPVWKEEASFDLPLFHPGNVERCTLYVTVMHRAQVGLDKFLGQGVVNLLDLHDNKSRMKTDWYKMVDKSGKEDKVRGEVLLDIQFMRNNMSASMFDLSMQDKPRSRISKLKDKVRGKKKDGASDSVSAIVPHVSQVLTDSEGEADAQSLNQATGEKKKKSKVKNLFAPKSNLQRNMSQSMSTLPEKNSSLSSSRSSGLNVDSSEGKKKFKLLGHKRTGSSDSKVSLGAFSLLGRSKQNNSEQNNLCINGSHVYTEEAEAKTGSSLSLNSSGLGSVEDVHKHTSDTSADVNRSAPVPSHSNDPADKALLEQQRHQQEENRRQMEEKRLAEAKRLEEEKYRAEAKRLQEEEQRRQQEEQERRRRYLEDEANRKKQEEEERRNEEERRRVEAAESQKLEEERRKAEEQKRQEEASMSDRLSSLFGMIKKKEEKKDEVHPPAETHHTEPKSPDIPVSHHSTNPFEDVPLPSDPPPVSTESPSDPIKFSRNQQTPSGMVHLNRTAKVSAVKPRLPQIVECEAADSPSLGQQCPTPAQSESTLSSVPSDSPDTVSSSQSSSVLPGSLCGNAEVLSFVESEGSSPTMGDPRKRSALQPPSYSMHRKQPAENPAREFRNPGYEDDDGSQQNKVSLPDYNMLFPQKRHGVQGQTRWDNLVTEFNKRHRDDIPKLMGPEMSVDEPEEQPSPRSKVTQENPIIRKHRETKPASSKKVAAPAPPKNVASQMLTSGKVTPDSLLRSISPAVQSSGKTSTSSGKSKDASTPRPPSRVAAETTPTGDERKPQVATNKEAPTAKPRQRVSASEPAKREESGAKTSIQAMSSLNTSSMNKQEKVNFSQSDQDSRPQLKHEEENNVSGDVHGEQTPEKRGGDVDKTDNLSENVNRKDSDIQTESRKKDEHSNPGFQRKNSSRRKILLSSIRSEKMFTAQQEAVSEELAALPTANPVVSARAVSKASVPPQPESHWTPESSSYGEEEPFPAAASSLPLSVVLEEPATQADHLSEGKPHLKAWVPPSGVQSVSSGVGLSPRRPHPVKPLNAAVNQTSPPAVKQIKVWDTTLGKNKLEESAESGPYSQLTSEELIKLVVKQQTDLSKKEAKITELEEYIDNLLVRVIEEKPTILNALNIAKPV